MGAPTFYRAEQDFKTDLDAARFFQNTGRRIPARNTVRDVPGIGDDDFVYELVRRTPGESPADLLARLDVLTLCSRERSVRSARFAQVSGNESGSRRWRPSCGNASDPRFGTTHRAARWRSMPDWRCS